MCEGRGSSGGGGSSVAAGGESHEGKGRGVAAVAERGERKVAGVDRGEREQVEGERVCVWGVAAPTVAGELRPWRSRSLGFRVGEATAEEGEGDRRGRAPMGEGGGPSVVELRG